MASVIDVFGSAASVRRDSASSADHPWWSKCSSACCATRDMVATTLTGSTPTAVSPESITALEPSQMAFATSETSARVGVGSLIMDSNIWVAVIAGRPSEMHCRMICFWKTGRDSMPHSLPRSPRATITAPDFSMIPRRSVRAAAVSILATTRGPNGCGSRPRRSMSSAERTNERAIMSTSYPRKNSTARRSSGVGAERESRSAGMWSPGRPERTPPWTTVEEIRSPSRSPIWRITRPSPMLMRPPGSTSRKNAS